MIRVWVLLCALIVAPHFCIAQGFSGLARVDMQSSSLTDMRRGIRLTLSLSQAVPWRIFTLDDPRRLVMDFREIDWSGVEKSAFVPSDFVSDMRFGTLRPGWSRLVLDLSVPLIVRSAGMEVSESDGRAMITLEMQRSSPQEFAKHAGAPEDPEWTFLGNVDPVRAPDAQTGGDTLVVVIDPGHGGIDPGAEYSGVREAEMMRVLGQELYAALARVPTITPYLTRESDVFVSLEERMTLARSVGAGLFISLHMDALEGPQTTGATVYTLASDAEDEATQRMAERHDRTDLVAGVDLHGQDDEIATILMELARRETGPAGARFAATLLSQMRDRGLPLAPRPDREALLAVLTSADFPSVLLEVGFLSNPRDLARIEDPQGRTNLISAIVTAIQSWSADEAALAPLNRR